MRRSAGDSLAPTAPLAPARAADPAAPNATADAVNVAADDDDAASAPPTLISARLRNAALS